MKCNVCEHDIRYKDKVSAILKRDGNIICNGCKTTYILNKSNLLIDIIITFIGLSMLDLFQGFKGFFICSSCILLLEMIAIGMRKVKIDKQK